MEVKTNSSDKNYLPLFRKYRPQAFKDVVGQESLTKALSNAIELNRIANAYLFCGPRGTGKTSSARIFAKSLNCVHGPTLEPCQKCPSCIDITNATGLDVIEIDAASNRGIQDAKDLITQVQYAPINGKYKIFIIDEVHMLSNDAFNALLKTFEEPPENVIFILATTEPHKVLETIVSRCQRFDLKRITTDDIIKRLREISDLENIKISDDALFAIAKNVSGGLRDSLALLDQVSILGVKEEITKDLIEELLGKINFDTLFDLFKSIIEQNIEKTLIAIDEIYSKGNEPRNLAENFIEFLRNIILILNSSDIKNIQKLTYLVEEDIKKVVESNFDKDRTVRILNIIIEYYKEIKISTNPYLWMELAALAACKLDLALNNKVSSPNLPKTSPESIQSITIPVSQVQKQTDTKEVVESKPIETNIKVEPKPVVETPKQSVCTFEASSLDPSKIWANIIASIPSMPTRAFFSGVAKLVNIENQKITLGFLHENVLAQAKNKMSQLQTAINTVVDGYSVEILKIGPETKIIEVNLKSAQTRTQPPQIQYQKTENQTPVVSPDTPVVENPIKQEEISQEEETNNKIKKQYSPQVQDMIEQFNGRIIE